jgi:hypothetical protein
MTVNEFKMWLQGFAEALELDLSTGYDASDLEDIFEVINKKLDTVVPDVAPNQFPLKDVSPLQPNQFPLTQNPSIPSPYSPLIPNQFPLPKESPRYPNSPSVPGYIPNIYFTNNCDRLTPWPHSNSTIEDRGISK